MNPSDTFTEKDNSGKDYKFICKFFHNNSQVNGDLVKTENQSRLSIRNWVEWHCIYEGHNTNKAEMKSAFNKGFDNKYMSDNAQQVKWDQYITRRYVIE